VWVARYLGPEQFGSLSFVMALVALFGAFATLGLDSIVVRDIVRDPSCPGDTLGSASALKLAGSVVTVVLSAATVAVIRPGESTSFWMAVAISACTLFQSLDTIDLWFQSRLRSRYSVYARNAGFVVMSLARVGLILAGAPLIAFAVTSLIEAILAAAGLAVYYVKDGNSFSRWRSSAGKRRYLLKESWPLLLQGIVIMVYMRIDQILLGQLAGDRSVGEFAAAGRLVELSYFVPISLTASLFPEIIHSGKLLPEQYEGRIQKLYDLMIWMAIALAAVTTVCAPWIVRILYGDRYRAASTVLSLQIWMTASVFFGVARQKWLTAEGHLKDALYVEVAGMLINVAANILLIPRYGAVGASLASLATAFGANLAVVGFSRPIRKSMVMYGRSLLLPVRLISARHPAGSR
jgi:PST family polysaccharide transporter